MARKKYVQQAIHVPAGLIVPLNINGLDGRMLRIPAAKKPAKREIMLLYGSHSSLERMYSVTQELSKFGNVTLPDWPGFGGMDSLFKIGKKPTIDTMADYLAAFVKLRYRRQRYTIVGSSYGFIIATRMLQKYPELAKQVDLIVSMVGFVSKDDFHLPRRQFLAMKYITGLFQGKWSSRLAQLVVRPPVIRMTYRARSGVSAKMHDAHGAELKRRIDFEVVLWMINDLRTYFYTAHTMFILNMFDDRPRIKVPVYHLAVMGDQFFDNQLVEQHLNVLYRQVTVIPLEIEAHMPTIVADTKEVEAFFPAKLRRVLARSS